MNIDSLTRDKLSELIPNLLPEVDDERSLFDRLQPFISSAKLWLESEYLGNDEFLSSEHNDIALKIVVSKAFADAIPSLDLIITPSGFGVINTDNLAPASKERIERLIASLRGYVFDNLVLLVDICRSYESWRLSECGRYFCSSFISSLSVMYQFPNDDRPSFDWIHDNALMIEKRLEMDSVGKISMDILRDAHNSGNRNLSPEMNMCIDSIISLITSRLLCMRQGRKPHSSLAAAARAVVSNISLIPELAEIWADEIGRLGDSVFQNDIKGSFYF